MINCTQCTHYQHNADQHLCDAGIFDIRIFGKAYVTPSQKECKVFVSNIPEMTVGAVIKECELVLTNINKKRGRPAKC